MLLIYHLPVLYDVRPRIYSGCHSPQHFFFKYMLNTCLIHKTYQNVKVKAWKCKYINNTRMVECIVHTRVYKINGI